MKLLDVTLPSPAENLALEEALLDAAEAGASGEILRFWESPVPFVVVGYANSVATEVNTAACSAQEIPVLRRCSGGGTIVQGPGCLNYAVILRITKAGPTRNITTANGFVMERIRAGIQSTCRGSAATITIEGHTDLAIVLADHPDAKPVKFSGNAQRRRKDFLLFHGTLLLDFDLPLISRLLNQPSFEPAYRSGRPHRQFITNLGLPATQVKAALAATWQATEVISQPPAIPAALLQKYRSAEWNLKL